ncbi:MAG: alpha/beta fold hydrolase [Anaerotardibacter sp.]
MLCEYVFPTAYGPIRYWTNKQGKDNLWLVMLPGLTADHHLFDEQVKEFVGKVNLLTWDPPAHGQSKPWDGPQDLYRDAGYLHEILEKEGITEYVLIGQSMGGYLSQMYIDRYPGEAKGFISVDSASLKSSYYTKAELEFLKNTYWIYRSIPWKLLIEWGATGCSTTPYGQAYMKQLIGSYNQKEYCRLADAGYKALYEAVTTNRAYFIDCPFLALCGEHDAAGSTKRYNKNWQEKEGINLVWVPGAGHNSNRDNPEFVNNQIKEFIQAL